MTDKRAVFNALPPDVYCFADSTELCQKLLEAGARVIQLRAKTMNDEDFTILAHTMQKQVAEFPDAIFIVNDRVNVGLAIDADGIHIGQDDEAYDYVMKRVPETMIVGVSVVNVEQAIAAEQSGATYLGAGSVYPTSTKSDVEVIGVNMLRQIVEAVSIPVVAIGGISLENVDAIFRTGVRHAAVISAINNARSIKRRLSRFRKHIAATLAN
ncbi:thiamine phosphate synthase [candidate division KSB1 bacterium]|nr:thiamine phosphate synthase [candidate division KSB1 bacterium]